MAAPDTSSGRPIRPRGGAVFIRSDAAAVAYSLAILVEFVSMNPGEMELTRIPLGASSAESALEIMWTPPLLRLYSQAKVGRQLRRHIGPSMTSAHSESEHLRIPPSCTRAD